MPSLLGTQIKHLFLQGIEFGDWTPEKTLVEVETKKPSPGQGPGEDPDP